MGVVYEIEEIGLEELDLMGLMDMNGDRLVDVVVDNRGRYGSNSYTVYTNKRNGGGGGGGRFVTSGDLYRGVGDYYDRDRQSFGDMNGDGMVDMVINLNGLENTNGWLVYTNQVEGSGRGFYYKERLGSEVDVSQQDRMGFRDMDGDGDMDMLYEKNGLSESDKNKIEVWLNKGGELVYETEYALGESERWRISEESLTRGRGYRVENDGRENEDGNDYELGSYSVYGGAIKNRPLKSLKVNNTKLSYEYEVKDGGLGYNQVLFSGYELNNGFNYSVSDGTRDPGHINQRVRIEYEDGKYDKEERILYGYGLVRVIDEGRREGRDGVFSGR